MTVIPPFMTSIMFRPTTISATIVYPRSTRPLTEISVLPAPGTYHNFSTSNPSTIPDPYPSDSSPLPIPRTSQRQVTNGPVISPRSPVMSALAPESRIAPPSLRSPALLRRRHSCRAAIALIATAWTPAISAIWAVSFAFSRLAFLYSLNLEHMSMACP